MPASTADRLAPGDLLDLGEHCPTRCVTWSDDGTCWGLTRDTRRKARRPETAVYQVIGPVDDPDAWTEGTAVARPEPAPAGAGSSPPTLPPAPPASDPASPDPVERIRAVFGPDVYLVADPDELARLAARLVDAQGQRDAKVLTDPAWVRLVAAVAAGNLGELIGAGRAVIDWCEVVDPERLGLGGWKRLVVQVEGFEHRNPAPATRLVPWRCECPEGERVPGEPCKQRYHTES